MIPAEGLVASRIPSFARESSEQPLAGSSFFFSVTIGTPAWAIRFLMKCLVNSIGTAGVWLAVPSGVSIRIRRDDLASAPRRDGPPCGKTHRVLHELHVAVAAE